MGHATQRFFGEGQPLDALVLDTAHPVIATRTPEQLTSTIVYASDASMHLGTLVAGEWIVKEGRAPGNEKMVLAYQDAMQNLISK